MPLVALVALVACAPVVPTATSRAPAAVATAGVPSRSAASSPRPSMSMGPIVVTSIGATLPGALSRELAFAAGPDILVCGGLLSSGETTAAIVRVNLGDQTATRIGSLAVAVHDSAGATIDGLNLVLGGGNSVPVAAIQTCPATGPSAITGQLPAPRADAVAVGVDVRGTPEIIVAGGGNGSVLEPDVLATADGVSISTIGTLKDGVRYPAVVVVGRSVVVIGGYRSGADVSAIQVVDPTTGEARIVGHLPTPLAHASAFLVGNSIVVAGGTRNGALQASMWAIDPTTWAVSKIGNLPQPTSDMATVALGADVFLVGGEGPHGPVDSILEVQPG